MKYAFLFLLIGFLPAKFVHAETVTDGEDENRHFYSTFEEPKKSMVDSAFEAMPLIGGKFEEIKKRHCEAALKNACADAGIAQISRMNQLNTGPEACKAWAKDCKDVVSRKEVVKIFEE